MGANGTGRAPSQRGRQQYQQHGGDIARGIEAQVDHVEMTTRNKNLVHLITDGANGAKKQSEYVPESRARQALAQAHRHQRSKKSYKEELNGMCDATNVGTHPQTNGRKRVGMNGGSR